MPVYGRSNSAVGRGSNVVGRNPFRGANCENTNPNIKPCGTGTNGRMSPQLGVRSVSNTSQPLYAACSAGCHPGALGDITNVTGARTSQTGDLDKVQSFRRPVQEQPSATLEANEEKLVVVDADKSNVQNAAEYVPDIYNHLFQDESSFLPRPDYMDAQTDVTAKMRGILIDWLIEVHMKYKLRFETLHLTTNLIDRYLSQTQVMRKRLQLVGVTAMFIAAKFEEINPPELRDWVYITDNAYTKADLLAMECSMLTTLDFQVMVPTAAHFFEGLQKANGCDAVHRSLSQYILELGLLDTRILQHAPSHVVSAVLLLSNELLGRSQVWPRSMVQHSRHTQAALRTCAEDFRQLLQAERAGANQLQSVRKKFSDPHQHSVAEMAF